jgi:UDP-N-acetylmuramoylalanine--D-glutamate ligase
MSNLRDGGRAARGILEPVGVLGVGVEGRSTLEYLLSHGATDVTALDARPVTGLPAEARAVFGDGYDRGLERFATIFRSPGIRPDHPELARAAGAGTAVTSALSFFMERCPCEIIGFTGTVGKGTASSIAAAALEASGIEVHLGGNIGRSPLDFLDEVRPDHRVVLEISSFQAMDLSVSPRIGVILRTTTEHLDWHVDTAEYRAAKAALLCHQRGGDVVIYNADSRGAAEIAAGSRGRRLGYSLEGPVEEGIFLRGEAFVRAAAGGRESPLPIGAGEVALAGRFNLENVAAGILAALEAGGREAEACRAAAAFRGLPHRLELVVEGGGIRYYNDSYATRPEAAIAAVRSFSGVDLSLVMGGSEKHADFAQLVDALVENEEIVHVGLIGATADRMEREIAASGRARFPVRRHDGLEDAMEAAAKALPRGGVLLMAPACASFGLFENYKARGESFRAHARRMAVRAALVL